MAAASVPRSGIMYSEKKEERREKLIIHTISLIMMFFLDRPRVRQYKQKKVRQKNRKILKQTQQKVLYIYILYSYLT